MKNILENSVIAGVRRDRVVAAIKTIPVTRKSSQRDKTYA